MQIRWVCVQLTIQLYIICSCCSEQCCNPCPPWFFSIEICLREGRGLPRVIVSDNDKLFTANFWRTLFQRFGTKLNFTYGARSQHSNGLAERTVEFTILLAAAGCASWLHGRLAMRSIAGEIKRFFLCLYLQYLSCIY